MLLAGEGAGKEAVAQILVVHFLNSSVNKAPSFTVSSGVNANRVCICCLLGSCLGHTTVQRLGRVIRL